MEYKEESLATDNVHVVEHQWNRTLTAEPPLLRSTVLCAEDKRCVVRVHTVCGGKLEFQCMMIVGNDLQQSQQEQPPEGRQPLRGRFESQCVAVAAGENWIRNI